MSDFLGAPAHVGIIMDGNGRWAQYQGLPRTAGHKEGLQAAKRVVTAAVELGIEYLTLYAFSTENWRRAEEEVSFLMRLIQQHLRREYDFYRENGIRVIHCGDLRGLPDFVQKEIHQVMADTRNFSGLTVNLAINYGGRDEVVRSVNRWLNNGGMKTGQDRITEADISVHLDNPRYPEMDLIIRTGGERRLSNFLLWQSAYAELYFSDKFWPEWQGSDLREAADEFVRRERRFGGMGK